MLTRDQLLGAKVRSKTINIPELGGDVTVRGLKGFERDAFEDSLFRGDGKARVRDTTNLRARFCVLCLVNEDGSRMFKDEEAGELGQIDAAVLDKIFDVAQELCGMAPGSIEAAAKNSASATAGASSSS